MFYLALHFTLLTSCSATEASLLAATMTEAEKKAGYQVVMVIDDELIEVDGLFDEV